MRKRSVQEIIEVFEKGGTPSGINPNFKSREEKIAAERNKANKEKPSIQQQRIDQREKQLEIQKQNADSKTKKAEAIEKTEAAKRRSAEKETQASKVTSRENLRKTIAGGKPNIQKTQGGNKSISDTGTVASNALKRGASLVRTAAAIPANIAKQKAKANLGKMQMDDGEAPDKGTTRQKIGYAAKKSGERINTAVTNTRRKAGRGIETVGRKLANEDYIHEAEKDSSKEVKKKTIDVMKGKNAVEVNPKIQAEETMSPAQKRKDTNLKKKYDDSDMKQNMIDQYGEEEGLKVYYATIRKQAMKKKKKKKIKEDVSGLEVQDVSDGLKFREYEFIDVIKNEPMKSPKNNITWTEEVGSDGEGLTPSEQRKGLGMSGSGIRKLKKDMVKKGNFNVKKNLTNNTPDEQHTTTTSEAKAPVGLMKLAAMVADNNKKRKNALQIQKVIGEETPDAISGKDLKRISALSGKQSRFGDGSEGKAKRKTALEKKRGMKLDDHPQFKTEIEEGRRGQSKSAYGRNPYDNVTSSVKKITRTGIGPGIEHYSDDEKKKSEKEKIKDAKDPKKNTSRERATQNMQMIKRMTPEQKYARKMRIKQQQKDKK